MALPTFQSANKDLNMMQTRWAAELNPLLALPTSSPSIIKNVSLQPGDNTINHLLGRLPVGWVIIDQDASASIYRSKPLNNLTLTLNSSGAAVINLLIF